MARPSLTTQSDQINRLLSLALLLVAVVILWAAREVFIPLALALLFSFLLAPLVTRLEKFRLPRVLAALLTVLLAFSVLAGVGYLVGGQLIDLAIKLPDYKANISQRIASIKHSGGDSPFTKASETVKELGAEISGSAAPANGSRPQSLFSSNQQRIVPVQIVESATTLKEFLQSLLGPVFGPLGTAAIVTVFVLFMLIKREDLRDRVIHLIGRGRLNVTTQALDEAAHKVSGYLFMQVVVNVSFGVPVGIGLYFIGVPNAFLWGLLATLLRFVPYIGAWIALFFPLALSLAVTPNWRMPIETLALFATIELITSNVLEPWLYGAHTGLSPVAIMVATIFWTWLWGGVGLLLATPLTVCVAVLGKYIPSLSFLDSLLGDEPTLTPQERFYQRLLALDRREAHQVTVEYLRDHTLGEVYSDVFVPALAEAEREDQSGALSERRQRFIFDATREMVEEFGTLPPPVPKAAGKADAALEMGPKAMLSQRIVYCLPAADEADEIAATMLAQMLEAEGYRAEAVSFKTLANEMIEMVAESGNRALCISATPPHNTMHTRYLCKLLRSKFPQLHIVVGLWDADGDEEQLARRRDRLAADKVVLTLGAALEELRPFAGLDATATEAPALATA